MDRCPGRGSSIDLIIAWMFIFCRPQHQQPASRPHTAYFKSSHPLKPNTQIHIPMFLFSNDFDSWTGVMKPSQAQYTGHQAHVTVWEETRFIHYNNCDCSVLLRISHCAMSYVIQTHCIHHRYPLSRISITRNQTLSVMRIMSLKFKSHLVN